MKKFWKLLLCVMAAVLLLGGCCSHDWEEADCKHPRTCSECGKTEGEKGEHDWQKATCLQPKTCDICGKEKGDLGDHKWKDATCTEPEQCRTCGETRGEPAGHRWEDAVCRTCGSTRAIATEPAIAEAPAAVFPGLLEITPDQLLGEIRDYAYYYCSRDYELGEVVKDGDQWYVGYINYKGTPAFELIMLLDEKNGCVDRITLRQWEANVPDGDLISVYPVVIALWYHGAEEDIYDLLYGNLSTQDTVYEIYELDGYNIEVWREKTDEGYLHELEIFYLTVF